MSGLGSWLWGTSTLDDAIDRATSELIPVGSEDIALNLEICDQIRSKSAPAKDAMRALKRRLNHRNPNVQNLTLSLTDICVKNGGDLFLAEVASREFMDNLDSILRVSGLNQDVKQHILKLIQNWSIAFEGKHHLAYVGQVYKTLVNDGFNFPPKDLSLANSMMVDTQTAPEWIDSDVCLRCRTAFTFTNRKHHCRNCGQVFDQGCSSKSMALPHFGITQEVRVCDGCYSKLTRKAERAISGGHRHSASMNNSSRQSARELADAELQRAIQLSLQEVTANGHSRPGYVPSPPTKWQYSEPPLVDRSSRPTKPSTIEEEEDDPDLRAAIEASLREANAPKPSAPVAVESPRTEYAGPGYSQSYPPSISQAPAPPAMPSYDLEPLESDAILTFSQTINQVEAQGGRDISRYPAVNELFDKANSLRPKLALSLDDAELLSEMHDKLSQAVKLYDKILTEQVERPTWRSSPSTSSYQPAEPSYNTVNSSSQWASPTPVAASAYQTQAEPSRLTMSPQVSHAEYQRQSYIEPLQKYQPYATPATSQVQSLPSVTLPPVSLSPQPYQSHTMSPLSFQTLPPSQEQLQHAVSTLPPPPPQQHQQPLQQQQTYAFSPSSPSLNRHKTVSYTASPSAPPPINGHLTRSNTVAPPRQQVQHSSAPMLPQFPVAPTSAPTAVPMYGPPAPTGFASPEERKEALLIDL
ncbi:Vacuolar protein sorting-associated protein 27 [Termitomyces sp. J132]|nr:Vacuolar protein sorting-associated protein 27 [Termitomyces sp. J132]